MLWKIEKDKLGKEITEMLYDAGMIRTWYRDKPEGWMLMSGLWSPVYINLRHIGSHPEILKKVGFALGRLIKEECGKVNRIVGVATSGVPISTAIAIEGNYPMGYTRKIEGVKNVEEFREKIAQYGQHAMVEGEFGDGDNIAMIDDIVTNLGSKLIAVEQFRAEANRKKWNAGTDTIIVVLDREQGASEIAKENNLKLHSLIPFKTRAIEWLKEKFSDVEYETLSNYLQNSEKYQNKEMQEKLKKQSKFQPD